MRKYKLVITYNPKNESIESIKEYIIEDEVEFIVEGEEVEIPEKLAEMIHKYCDDATIGVS